MLLPAQRFKLDKNGAMSVFAAAARRGVLIAAAAAGLWIIGGCGDVSAVNNSAANRANTDIILFNTQLIEQQSSAILNGTELLRAEAARQQTIAADVNECRLLSAQNDAAAAAMDFCLFKKGYIYVDKPAAAKMAASVAIRLKKEHARIVRLEFAKRQKAKREQHSTGQSPNVSPWIIAIDESNLNALRALSAATTQINARGDDGSSALHLAAQADDVQLLLQLLSAGANVRATDNRGDAALHLAAAAGHVAAATILIAAGADVNAADNHGYQPLHRAAAAGHVGMATILIAAGADVNAPTHDGYTALHAAAYNQHLQLVKILLAAGANANMASYFGATALDMADKDLRMIKILKNAQDEW